MTDNNEQHGAIERRRGVDRRSARVWHDRLTALFKRLTEDPEHLAAIERCSF